MTDVNCTWRIVPGRLVPPPSRSLRSPSSPSAPQARRPSWHQAGGRGEKPLNTFMIHARRYGMAHPLLCCRLPGPYGRLSRRLLLELLCGGGRGHGQRGLHVRTLAVVRILDGDGALGLANRCKKLVAEKTRCFILVGREIKPLRYPHVSVRLSIPCQ